MSLSYTCPNPDCGVTLKSPTRVAVGKSIKCPKCSQPFVPEPVDKDAAAPATFKLVEDEPKKPAKPAKSAPAAASPPPPPPPAPAVSPSKKQFQDDDDEDADSVRKGYGVISETEAEKEEAEKNKPKFTEVQDKFKKSARGPAMSLLVQPSNILTIAGLVTCAGGLLMFVVGMWPLVFNDAPPGEEELEEAIIYMLLGVMTMFWGAMVCFGASQMQELGSYAWAMVGSVMGIAPFLVGVYCIVMLQNPKVKAGFAEGDLADEDEDEDKDDDEDDDEDEEDDDDDDDDDDGGSAKKAAKKAGKKFAKKLGKGLLKKAMGGGDDE
jgi:hypothetical protein